MPDDGGVDAADEDDGDAGDQHAVDTGDSGTTDDKQTANDSQTNYEQPSSIKTSNTYDQGVDKKQRDNVDEATDGDYVNSASAEATQSGDKKQEESATSDASDSRPENDDQ